MTFSGRKASQNEFELKSFLNLLIDKGVESYLEIGARDGDTFHYIMSGLPIGSYGMAVDMPGALWGKKKTDQSLLKAVEDLREKGYFIDYILGDSQDEKTINEVRMAAESFGKFDAALIDGDHTYKGVSADFNNYHNLAEIVALHDIVGTGQFEKVNKNPVEVPILWKELKEKHETLEFVDKDSLMGIGVCLL